MKIEKLDHLVLTVKSIDETCQFYEKVMGMKLVTFGDNRKALTFGSQKINLHQKGNEIEPKAQNPTPGSADLCFITSIPLEDVLSHIKSCGVEIINGPVKRTGAIGQLISLYFRDPDGNLLEVSNYIG